MTIFDKVLAAVEASEYGATMKATVEDSPWHRESDVWCHTMMCLEFYDQHIAQLRTPREQLLTRLTLLFHDFGKPGAEEVVEKKDGSGDVYRRYAGHEPISANCFMDFICSNKALTEELLEEGKLTQYDLRKIKFMIEQHLPYGLKNPTKREQLRHAVQTLLGPDEQCFYDQLYSDCCGRISDDHETKKQAVRDWIDEFIAIKVKPVKHGTGPTMYLAAGPVGAGKTSLCNELFNRAFDNGLETPLLVSEDYYRLQFYSENLPEAFADKFVEYDPKEFYAAAWRFCCIDNKAAYEKYVTGKYEEALKSGLDIFLDSTNQSKKSRARWLDRAKHVGYRIIGYEFYLSKKEMLSRQITRDDKEVPAERALQIYNNMHCIEPAEANWVEVRIQFD